MHDKGKEVTWMRCLSTRAAKGAPGARELLELTPCDLWPFLRGRTLWLVGDSMMQVCAQDAAAIACSAHCLTSPSTN